MKLLSVAAGVVLLSVGLTAQGLPTKGKKLGMVMTVGQLGCSTAAGADSVAITAWSWGVSNSGSASSGGGAGAGRANFQDLSVSKVFDACSPALFGGVATGRHFPTLTLVQGNADGSTTTLTLTDVLVSSWSVGGTAADPPTENVTFNFARVSITDGTSGAKFGWDVVGNKPQ